MSMINRHFRELQIKKISCLKESFVFKLRVISKDLKNISGQKIQEAKK